MTQMTKGGNIPVTVPLVRATLFWSGGDGVPDVDASAVLLQADGRVSSDADLVFYNQPTHVTGAVKHAGKTTGALSHDVIDVNLGGMPTTIDRIALAASADGGTFGQVPGLRLVISDLSTGTALAEFAMTADAETAFVTGELYRRDAGWKFRAVGQGFSTGLAGLAAEFGIDVGGDGSAAAEPEPVPEPAAAPAAPVLPPPSFDLAPPTPAPTLDLTPPAVTPEPTPEPAAVPPAPAPEPTPTLPAPSFDLAPPAAAPAPEPPAPAPSPSLDLTPPAAPAPSFTPPTDTPAPSFAPPADTPTPWPAPPTDAPAPWPAAPDAPPAGFDPAAAPPTAAPAPPMAAPAAPDAPPFPPMAPPAPPVAAPAPPDAAAAPASWAPPVAAPPPTDAAPPGWGAPPVQPGYGTPADDDDDSEQSPGFTVAPPPTTALPAQTLDAGPVVLAKNERVTLASAAAGPLARVMLDLSWVPAPGRLSVDLDASVIAFDASGKKLEIVWYQHQNEFSGALQHTGDAKGEGVAAAMERVLVDLPRLPDEVSALVFTITSFHGHTFTDLQQASVVLSDDTGRPIVTYDLVDTQPSTAVLMAIIRRIGPGVWQMRAIGEYHDFRTVKKLVDPAARHVGIY